MGITERVSIDSSGQEGNGHSDSPAISADGRFVAFSSESNNLVINDTNGVSDIFVRDRGDLGPHLDINHQSGAPGSFFTVNGINFPPSDTATLAVNGTPLGTVSAAADGSFTFLLSTASADEGAYFASVTVNPSATVGFILDSNEPIHPQEGTGPIFKVPVGIAFTESIFLPVILRQ
jgi:hypothetical protein